MSVDQPAAAEAVRALLVALGQDLTSESLMGTPARVAASFAELLSPHEVDLTTFPNDEGYDELVLARDIPLSSLCEHHLLPFKGVAHSATSPVTASSDCRSWPAWWNCSPAVCRCRSG